MIGKDNDEYFYNVFIILLAMALTYSQTVERIDKQRGKATLFNRNIGLKFSLSFNGFTSKMLII